MYDFVKENQDQIEASSIVLLEDGTLPNDLALSYQNDTDTGLFRPANNTFSIATGGVERVRVNSDDTTFYQRAKEQSFFNTGYYATMRDALPVIKNQQTVINTISTWVNPISVAPTTLRAWVGIAYSESLKRFVAVSQNSVDAVYSNDGGNNWISTSISSLDYFKLVWQNNLFIAIGFVRSYSTSVDGITWIERTNFFPTVVDWRDVIWLPQYNRWLACTSNNTTNKILQSPDITTNSWTATGINQPSQFGWHSFAYSPEMNMLVCVAVNTLNNVAYSTDGGLNWTQITVGTTAELRDIVWSRELNLFVAVGNNGVSFWSENGINWTAGTGLSLLRYLKVLWIPELHIFIAPSDNLTPVVGGTEIGYSFDGKIWSNINILGNDFQIRAIAYSPQHANICMASRTETTPVANNRERFFRIPLSNRWPTSDNVFNHAFNSINDSGTWSFSRMLLQGGSQTAPALSFSSPETGANSGIFNPGDGQISISTNDVERLRQSNDFLTFFTKQQFNHTGISDTNIVLTNATTPPFLGVATIFNNVSITLPNDFSEFVGRNTTFFIGKNHTSNRVTINCPTGHFINGVENGIYEMFNMGCVQVIYEFYNPGGGVSNRSLWSIHKCQGFDRSNDRDLQIPSSGRLLLQGGTQTSPSLSFSNPENETNSGIFNRQDGEVNITTNNNEKLRISDTSIRAFQQIQATNGTAAAPSIAFTNATGNGLYLSGGAAPFNLGVSVNGIQKINIQDGTGVNNLTTFSTNINVPSGDNSNPAITFNSSQNHGFYATTGNDKIFMKLGGTVHRFEQVTSEIPSQLKTRSIINDTILVSTGTNQTLARLDTLVYGNFIYELTAAIDVNLPVMQTGDVGLCLKIGKNSGAFALTVKVPTGDYLNNVLNGTYVLANNDYKYVQLILVKVSSGIDYWITQH